MVFQALIFKNEKVENGSRTAFASNLTANEENEMLCNGSSSLRLPHIHGGGTFAKIGVKPKSA
jgi:hypothetical protein